MKKILVPVDFSSHSEYALEVAGSIAKKHNAEIIALHMLGISEAMVTQGNASNAFEAMYYVKLAEKQFTEFLDKPYLKDCTVTEAVYNYKAFSDMDRIVKEYEADFIIMGSHGSSGLSEVFVGSNTEKVVRNASVPVLVVKNRMGEFSINKAVFACDFREESVGAYHKAMDLFKSFNADVSLVYVNLPGENYRSTDEITSRINVFFEKAQESKSSDDVICYNDYTVEDGIFNAAAKINADIIALPTHGRRGLAHFFSGSIGEDLVNHSTIPTITIKI